MFNGRKIKLSLYWFIFTFNGNIVSIFPPQLRFDAKMFLCLYCQAGTGCVWANRLRYWPMKGTEHFDIGGGGAGIFSRNKLFFLFFYPQQVIFFKSKLQQGFL